MQIGFTGTQYGISDGQEQALQKLMRAFSALSSDIVFHNGDCVGSDYQAASIAASLGWKIYLHPPLDRSKRAFIKFATWEAIKLPYLERNRNIVKASQALIATPRSKEVLRSGTWSTIRYARKLNKRVYIIYPDGSIVTEN